MNPKNTTTPGVCVSLLALAGLVLWWAVTPPAIRSTAASAVAVPPAAGMLPQPDSLKNADTRELATISTDLDKKRRRESAAAALREKVPGVRIDFDEITGGPKNITAVGKFLESSPDGGYAAVTQFVDAYKDLFGHDSAALAGGSSRITREDTSAHNGMKTVVWQQELDGIPFFQTILRASLTKNGELITLGGNYLENPSTATRMNAANRADLIGNPPVAAPRAVVLAAADIDTQVDEKAVALTDGPQGVERKQEFRAPAISDARAGLAWVPMNPDSARLAWDVTLMSIARGEMFRVLVDVENGAILVRQSLTNYISDASYRVFAKSAGRQPHDSPTPMSPGHATPLTTQPAAVSRELITIDALNTTASPNGWINDGVTQTLGNNVDAHTDSDGSPNSPDLPRPTSATRNFDFPIDFATAPGAYKDAAVTQLFYLNNWLHDELYGLGFTESAGNFQTNNFSRGGLGNDAVLADAQDSSGTNNANFSTPPDGSPGRMQMYVFTGPTPDIDGDFDSEIVIHEYVHGLSNRLVGGGVGMSTSQSRGMGEGWSDFYAMALLSEAGDDIHAAYASGGYATRQFSGLTQNYYFGIRRYPYSTNLLKNPLTFKDIDSVQASAHTGIPRSPIIGTTASEVHNQGEVWCVALWDVRANLITKHGFAAGNPLTLQLVTDGMKLSPVNPNFLQARDAIIQADMVNNAGANTNELWAAFAKRGMGASASSPSSSSNSGLVEAYDIADSLGVTPLGSFDATGQVGGTISPSSRMFTLRNNGTTNIGWTAAKTRPWLTLSSAGGTLPPGTTASVTASFNAAAGILAAGDYTDTITFTNPGSGAIISRPVTLAVEPLYDVIFADAFESGTIGTPWTITGTSTHRTIVTAANAPHAGGYHLTMDSSVDTTYARNEATLTLNLAGRRGLTLNFWVKMFSDEDNAPTTNPFTTGADFDGVAVSSDGGTIWHEIRELRSITNSWEKISVDLDAAVAARGLTYTSNFKIRFNHYDNYGITTDGFAFDDILIAEKIDKSLAIASADSAMEGDAPVTATLTIIPTPVDAVTISLASSRPDATVPASVVVPAGSASVTFPITPMEDTLLDGSQTVIITAAATTFANVSKAFVVHDNETAALALDLPDSIIEGSSPPTGLVTVDKPVDQAITVTLTCENPSLQPPASVTIPAGATSAQFSVLLVDDNQINGSRPATISASVAGWTEGVDTMTILDNEISEITLTLPVLREGDSGKSGTAVISGTLPDNLVVTLSSSDTTELVTPASVTILAGKTSATFPLTVVNDLDPDGGQPVTLTASAAGFPDATVSAVVGDNDAHHFAVAAITGPVLRNAKVPFTITAKDLNDVTITNYNQTLGFTAADASMAGVPVTPATSGSFTNGVLVVNLAFGKFATGVVLTASDGGGHLGTSNSFDVVTGPLDHFTWSTIPATQYVDAPFQTTLRAVDAEDNPINSFVGRADLSAIVPDKVEVLSWTTYADTSTGGEYALTKQAVSTYFTNYNETTTTTSDAATLAGLLIGKHVFLIPEQENGSSTTLGNLGTNWTTVLKNFVEAGGTVIACSHLNYEHLLLVNSGLLALTPGTTWTSASVTKTADTPLNANVAVPFTGSYLHGYTTTNGTVDLQTTTGQPVVISRSVGNGRVVLVGTDFNALGTGMDRVIANAVALSYQASTNTLPVSPARTDAFTAGEWTGPVTIPFTSSSIKLRAADGSLTADSNLFSVSPAQPGTPTASGMTLTLPATATEGAGPVSGTVTVTVAAAGEDPLIVNLTSKSPAKISVPPTILIPARQKSAVVPLTLLDDSFVDGVKDVIITASAAGYPEVYASVRVTDNDGGALGWILQATAPENGGNISGNVTLSVPALTPVTVSLASNLPLAAQVPATVVIPRGATSAPVSIAIPNDLLADGDQAVRLTATLAGWVPASADLLVRDDENRNLVVSIPAIFRESDGPKAGTVTLGGIAAADVLVSLSSSNPAEIAVTPTITIPAGTSSASFILTVQDDSLTDGSQPFTVTASSPSFTSGQASGFVRDNEAHHFTFAAFGSPQLRNGPVPAIITARDALGGVITDFNLPVTLTATSNSGPLAVSPSTGSGFVNGIWAGSVQINALATNVVLTVTDGLGHSGSSNPFDLVDGAINRFEWSTIPSPQTLDTPFTTSIRAVDAGGATVTGYNGIASLFLLAPSQNPTVGTGATSLIYGIPTYSHDSRVNSLYTAAELGGAARLSALSFNVTSVYSVGETLGNWTIRLKHTSLTSLGSVTGWDNTGWTTVYRASPVISSTGWVTFTFTTPFDFNGSSNLLVDCSMDRTTSNSSYTYVEGTSVSGMMFYGQSNSINGDPLTWSGSTPSRSSYSQRANLRFTTLKELPIRPAQSGSFANGIWTGEVSIPVAQNGVALRAKAGATVGDSNTFDVAASPTTPAGGTTVFTEDFESGSLNPIWWTSTGTGNFRTQVTSSYTPHGGIKHMAMDTTSSAARNEATLTVNLAGRTGATLKFWAAGYSDEPSGPPASPFTGGADFDGVAISADGTTWWEVQAMRSLPSTYGQFTVDLDAAIAARGISYGSAFKIRFNQYDDSSLTADGIVIDDILLTAHPLAGFSLALPTQVAEGDGTATASVTLDAVSVTDTVVGLSSSAPAKLAVPVSVTIPAGQLTAPFTLTIPDDTISDGNRVVAISGTATGKPVRTVLVTVVDDDRLPFTLTAPATVAEGVSVQTGTLTLGAAASGMITVNLLSSDTTELTVPTSVVLQPGQTVATFPITVVNDTEIDGTQSALITADIPGGTTVSATVQVTDNETRGLSLSGPSSAYEGTTPSGTVYLTGTLPTALTVALTSSNPAQYSVPATVSVPAGQTSASFTATVVDDTATDGTQTITITATAVSFTSAITTTYAYDNDLHHFGFTSIASIQKNGIPFSVTISAQDVNNSVISPFVGSATLTASGTLGTMALTPPGSITFSSGYWTGNVTCATADTNVKITATGGGKSGLSNAFEVQKSPAISLNPTSLALTLNPGQSTTRTLTIQNTGGGTLTWNMAGAAAIGKVVSSDPGHEGTASPKTETPPTITQAGIPAEPRTTEIVDNALATLPLASALNNLNFNNALVRAAIPNRYAFSEGVTGTSISDGGGDMYDGGNYLGTNLGSSIPYSDNLIASSTVLGSGGQYFTRKYEGLWVFAADVSGLSYFEITGNLGADGSGTTDSTVLSVVREGVTYRGFVKRVYGSSDPSVNHLVIMADNGIATHAVGTTTDDDYHRVTGLTGITRVYHVLYAGTSGAFIDNPATLNLMNVFLDSISAPDWVSPSPLSGSIAAGASQTVTLTINAANLTTGIYNRTLVVTSNDPAQPSASLALTLTVNDVPNINVTPAGGWLTTGSRGGPFTPASQTFTLTNSGNLPANWTVGKTNAWFDLSASSGTLNAGATTTVTATLNAEVNALASGTYNDTLTFTNTTNGLGNTTRPVTLTITPFGELTVTPSSGLDATGPFEGPFTPSSRTYTLSNPGDAALSWTASKTAPWLVLSSASGTLAAGASTTVTATISAATTDPGSYNDAISFTNSTNGRGTTTRAVNLTVDLPAPILTPEPPSTGGTGNTVTWNTVPGAAEYEVQAATDSSFTSPLGSGWKTGTTHTFTGLTDGTSYHYRVRSRRPITGIVGSWTQTSQAEFATGAVTNASTSASPGNVVLLGTAGGVLTENFDQAGTSWASTIFPNVSAGSFTRTDLAGTGPNTTPPLPVNQAGDLEARLSGTMPSALLADLPANKFADGSIESWIAPAHQTALHYSGLLLRASRTGTTLNGYAAILLFYANGTVKADFTRIIGGSDNGASNWFYSNTTTFTLGANENIRAKFSIAGTTLTLRLWRVSVVGGIVTETPIPFYQGNNTLTATDSTYTAAGLAGLYDSYSSVNASYFDDVTVTGPIATGSYPTAGTLTSPAITPSPLQQWGTLAFTKNTTAAGTALTVDVLNAGGALLAANVPSGTDLNTLSAVASQPSVRLRANLSTSNTANTPRLDDWTVSWKSTPDVNVQSVWSPAVSSLQDATPPVVEITTPQAVAAPSVALGGLGSDLSGIASLTVNGTPAQTSDGFLHWNAESINLAPGWNDFNITASDTAIPANHLARTHRIYRIIPGGDSDRDGMPDAWEFAHGLDLFSDTGDAGALGDWDKDGLVNLLELAFGLDPAVADAAGSTSVSTDINPADHQPYLVIRYRRLIAPGTLAYQVEFSADCVSWSSDAGNLEQIGLPGATGDGMTETVAVRVKPAIGTPGHPGGYVRVKVIAN